MLALLARHISRVVMHEGILTTCRGGEEEPRLKYLRQKLEAPNPVGSVIANKPDVGHRLRADM